MLFKWQRLRKHKNLKLYFGSGIVINKMKNCFFYGSMLLFLEHWQRGWVVECIEPIQATSSVYQQKNILSTDRLTNDVLERTIFFKLKCFHWLKKFRLSRPLFESTWVCRLVGHDPLWRFSPDFSSPTVGDIITGCSLPLQLRPRTYQTSYNHWGPRLHVSVCSQGTLFCYPFLHYKRITEI